MMTEQITIPDWLFARDDLRPHEKWLYVCLLHAGGTWDGNRTEVRRLFQKSNATSLDIDRVLLHLQHMGILTFKREWAYHNYLWHIRLCIPSEAVQGVQP